MMASTSSSSPMKYDVFLSFKCEDTRDNFTSHLLSALDRKQIQTFIDDKLIRGDEISPSLLNAIENSKISVVIFSEKYADSRWCLEELVKILECKNKHGQIVIPVFYRVAPSDVRNQTGTLGDEFSKLEARFPDKLQIWKDALKEAANLSGFDSSVTRPECHLIEKIVDNIYGRLRDTFQSDNEGLVGVESRVQQIESLLSIDSSDVRILGIWGIGGIGKTTIAGVIFNRISAYFEGYYFAQNVRETEEKGQLRQLQKELFSSIFKDEIVKSGIPNLMFQISRLRHKKVLIVFDDVTCQRQIEFLIGHLDGFAPGSRIIITSRNKQVLRNCGVSEPYKIEELADSDALELFRQHAFKQHLSNESYVELSKNVIEYARGVPLALKVLGCLLFRKSKIFWVSIIRKLKRIPDKDIQEVLKISYDDLDDSQQNIFLDIVFFLVREDRDLAINIFKACGVFPESDMEVLVDKCLVTISANQIFVHDLLQDMGREIVRQESINDPRKHSRLCNSEDIRKVLEENKNLVNLKVIDLCCSKQLTKLPDLSLATNLETLNLVDCTSLKEIHCKSSVLHLNKLFSLLLYDCVSLESLPTSIHVESLRNLYLTDCINLKSLPSGLCKSKSLKYLSLGGCCKLERLPNKLGNLESLGDLDASKTAIKILPSSIGRLSSLYRLELCDCKTLKSLPSSFCELKSLVLLNLNGCSSLKKLPAGLGNLESLMELYAKGTAIREIPRSIIHLSELNHLNISDCKRIQCLPRLPRGIDSVYAGGCTSLKDLSGFSIFFASHWSHKIFDLRNCLELEPEKISQIVKEDYPNIWKKYYYWVDNIGNRICFPGSKVPEWFSYQGTGSSITLQSPSGWYNNKFVGFGLCAIASFPEKHHDNNWDLKFCCQHKGKTIITPAKYTCDQPNVLGTDIGDIRSNHVFLGVLYRQVLDKECCSLSEVFFQFYVESEDGSQIEYNAVKECGIHLLYEEEEERERKWEEEEEEAEEVDWDEEEEADEVDWDEEEETEEEECGIHLLHKEEEEEEEEAESFKEKKKEEEAE